MALRTAKWAGIAIGGLVLLVVAIVLLLDTGPGHRFLADRLADYETASGIKINAGRIDGSIYGRMTLRGVEVRDQNGVFVTIPELTVDWRPFAYARSHIDVRELLAPQVVMRRNPALKPVPSDPNAPLLPDIDLTVGRLEIGRLDLLPPVTGQRHVVRLAGSARIADGRAQISADAGALKAAGLAGGDRLHVMLDAVPQTNRFALDATLDAPAGGLVDSYGRFGKPLALTIGGRGDWANWRGQARGTLGGQTLATLDVTGRDGTFHTTGDIRPGLILTGPAARLAEPAITLDLTTALDKRRIDTRLKAGSRAFAAEVNGLIDLGAARFGRLAIKARLLTPGAIAPQVRGRDVALEATLDGPFATPAIAYRLSAATLGFGTTSITGLQAAGAARIDADRILVPVHATARAISGLNTAAGGSLVNLRVDGNLAYQNGQLATDDLRLRSSRIDATAIVLADLGKGTYSGALKGRVNDYAVQGLGRINLITDAKLVPGRNNGFAIRGHVRALTRAITNAAVAAQLGGPAVLDADVGYDLAGGATLANLRLRAPDLQIVDGRGGYSPDGRIAFHAAARSRAYGPATLDVSGTIARPQARLRATKPGLGIGLADLDATLSSSAAGYRVRARGRSDYGPLDADATIAAGGTRFDIANATIAGIRLAGSLARTPAGPFAGTLTLAGQGLNGTIALAAADAVQQATADLSANAARLPGPMPVTIGGGTLHATVALPAAGPQANGRFAFADIRSGALAIERAQGRIDYAAGTGRVALIAKGGQAGAPFDLALQAALAPTRIVANLTGAVNGIALRLAQPAVLTKAGASWTLAPATVLLPKGRLVASGTIGGATALHLALDRVDLGLVDAFVPGLGLGGTASGTIDYAARGAVPDLRARVDVAGFTRTAALTVSAPVDIALLATLNDAGGDARALIRRGGATVGRMQARLAPLGPGAGLAERLAKAPLSGGIRYNGPAEVLWALGGIARQQLSGPIAIGADFGGRLEAPELTGVIRANALRYENETYGTLLTGMSIDGRFTRSRFDLTKLTARAGRGTIAASGYVGLDAAGGFPIDLSVTLDRAQLARGDDLEAAASGTIRVTNGKEAGGLIKGELTIPEARYQIVRQGQAAVPELTGVRRKGAQPVAATAAAAPALPSRWALDIRVRAPNQIFVSGMGLEAEWRTDMRIGGTSAAPSVVGRLEVVRGTYSFASRRFEIDHGVVTFQGPMLNPALDIAAITTVEDVTATIAIAGYAQSPQISFTSSPALPQDEVLSRLLFGASVTSLSPTQAIQLAAALNGLRGSGGGGLNPLGKLRGASGIDRLRVLGADATAGRGTALAAGKYISNNIYVEVVTDARGFTATQLEISLSRALSVLSQTSSFGGSNVSLRYRKRY